MELVINNPESPNLRAALSYAAIGWHVFPVWHIARDGACMCGNADCKSVGKHPHKLAVFGQSAATTDESKIRNWWRSEPNANIGVFLEKSGLCALDIDPRNGGFYTIDDLEDKYGELSSDVLQFTGGGGEHRIFQKPTNNQLLPGTLGAGVDVKLNGYIVVWPSTHKSGGVYSWEASSNPLEGAIAPPLPDFLRSLAHAAPSADISPAPLNPLEQVQIDELNAALYLIPADDRQIWLDVGMALHNDVGGQQGYDIWCAWSEKSAKFNNAGQVRAWNSFKRRGISGITKATIFKLAMENGWHNTAVATELKPVEIAPELLYKAPHPEPLPPTTSTIRAPGILGAVQDYYDATAYIQQPMFAVQTALGIGSVILGRMFVTSNGNYSSLYFLNLTESATGKEQIKTVTERVLDACGFGDRIANDGYTSHAAVFGALMDRPCHITVIDEMGLYLNQATNKNNFIGNGSIDALMQVISKCDEKFRNKNFGKKSANAELSETHIERPALTILGMTTPNTFYDSIKVGQVMDGFLGRFIMHHSKMPRTIPAIRRRVEVPDSIAEWASHIKDRISAHDPLNTSSSLDNVVQPIEIEFTGAAIERFKQFQLEMLELMNSLDTQGIAALAGRSGEFAMRLSLISALSRNPYATQITFDDADWSCAYMSDRANELVNGVMENMHGSQHEKDKHDVLAIIRSIPVDKGITRYEMCRTKGLMRFKPKELDEILKDLMNGEYIAYGNVRDGLPGGKRDAFFAMDVE